MDGWINLDLPIFDVTKEESWGKMLGTARFDNAILEHVFEHLRPDEVETALNIFKLYMKATSNIRIAVPDKNHPNPDYIEYTRPGGSGPGADDHKSFWSIEGFKEIAEKCGFDLLPLEYYSSSGELISNEMNLDRGRVQRSARNELNSPIKDYSSLIFDLRLQQ
jgi:predicted SAM-dependent methyltransferase